MFESASSIGQHGSEGRINIPRTLDGEPTSDPRLTVNEVLIIFQIPVRPSEGGDANNNGAVTATDVSFVRSRINEPVAFAATSRADVNMSGSITGPDVSFVRSRIGHSAP